jgi:hypothetical protein
MLESSSSQACISRFFQPGGKKRPREATKIRDESLEPGFNVAAAGTAMDPLDLLDDDSSDEEAPAVVTTSRTDKQPYIPEPAPETIAEFIAEQCHDDEPKTELLAQKENPFACFAYGASKNPPLERTEHRPLPQWRILSKNQSNNSTSITTPKPPKKPKTCGFVKIGDLSAEEQERITKKWHSMADPLAPLEVRRFQVLVAARLHARCQEPSVRKAMESLREACPVLSVTEVAIADPEVLARYITNLQYYNVKAKQLVKAANEIKSQFAGMVPEDEHSLLQITGVGKVFADLLAFVNTRSAHRGETTEIEVENVLINS